MKNKTNLSSGKSYRSFPAKDPDFIGAENARGPRFRIVRQQQIPVFFRKTLGQPVFLIPVREGAEHQNPFTFKAAFIQIQLPLDAEIFPVRAPKQGLAAFPQG